MAVVGRREFVGKVCTAALVLPLLVAFRDPEPIDAGKIAKQKVNYQMVGRNGGRNCMNCKFFEPTKAGGCMGIMDARCAVVAGAISAMAYCDLFQPVMTARQP